MGYTPPYLDVRKVAGGWNAYGPSSTTGDDLYLYANTTDTGAYIGILGGAYVLLNGTTISFKETGGNEYLNTNYATPDVSLNCPIADKNIAILPTGTGLLKFGAYTAGAATDSTGYITILDAAGNTRKLMVQA